MEKLVMDVKEVKAALGLSLPKVYELFNSADFPAMRIGRRMVVPVDAFKRWMDAQTNEAVEK